MVNRTFNRAAAASLAVLMPVLLIACGGSDEGPSRTEVTEIVRSEMAGAPVLAEPGLSRADVEQIVRAAVSESETTAPAVEEKVDGGMVSMPRKSEPSKYTKFLVNEAIGRYEAEGLDATAAYYNTKESIDGQWYVFIGDRDDVIIAHAANPDLVGRPASAAAGPNGYPAGEAVAAVADEDGEWFDYTYTNPATGAVETKHSWTVRHDGMVFGTGWYEPGPRKSDAALYTQSLVRQALNLYDALGREETVAYYKTEESVDGPWYVFIIDQDGYTISHPNPIFLGRDPSLRVDATGYFYGDELLAATEEGRWVDYVLTNPESEEDRQKHSWVVRHDGLIFGSGWYE